MSRSPSQQPDEQQRQFFAKVGADVSHEMRNLLAIIGEYAGLLEDLLLLVEKGQPPDCARLRELAANIRRQVRKGTEAMERLSRFAHAGDELQMACDLTALAANVAALAQRRVSLAGCRLETLLPGDPVSLNTDAFALQQAVFTAIENLLSVADKDLPLTLSLHAHGTKATVEIAGKTSRTDLPQDTLARIDGLLRRLGGSLKTCLAEGTLTLSFSLPMGCTSQQ